MKSTIISIVIAIVIIGGAIFISKTNLSGGPNVSESVNNVSIVDGKQIVEIDVKGGYQPRKSVAKAGVPTIVRFVTKGTFDCSSYIRIPSMNIGKTLPQTGTTDIDLGTSTASNLIGMCGMGMYRFEIDFQS